jgi:heme-degrading monooxygenase HmoA
VQVVVSQAWTYDATDHARAYIDKSEGFQGFLARQPGFVARLLLRGTEDPTHFTNVRVFASAADYLAMAEIPEYRRHIDDLSEHVDASRYTAGYPRELTDLVAVTDLTAGDLQIEKEKA